MRLWNLLRVFFIVGIAMGLASRGSCSQCAVCDSLCGVRSVVMACQELGVSVKLDGLSASSGTQEREPALDRLAATIEDHHLYSLRTRLSVEELAKQDKPCVAMLWGNHMVFVKSDGKGGLTVQDASGNLEIPLEKFRLEFTGQVLIISKSGIAAPAHPSGPAFEPEWYMSDFGDVDHGSAVERTLGFRNAGDSDLVITSARTTCGCAFTTLRDSVVRPGQSSIIRVTINSLGRQGAQYYKLYVNSNDPVTPISQLGITGSVVLPKVSTYPERVSFGMVGEGSARFAELQVNDSGGRGFKVLSAETDLSFVKCASFPISDRKHPKYIVAATLAPDAPAGRFSGSITLKTTHPKEPVAKIAIEGEVSGLKAREIPVCFGAIMKGKAAEKTVSLGGDQSLSVECLENSLPHVSVKTQRAAGGGVDVVVSIDDHAPADLKICGPIVLRSNDPARPEIMLQVYARVVPEDAG